jgi:hypothetical protein
MQWQLAHRPRTADTAEFVELTADSSAAAIAALRAQIPADHKVLFVRRIYAEGEDAADDWR